MREAKDSAIHLRVRSRLKAHEVAFRFAQELKAIESADEAVATDPEILRQLCNAFHCEMWCGRNIRHGSEGPDEDSFFYEVLAAWPKVRAPGSDALVAALRHAERAPLRLTGVANALGKRFVLLVSTAYYLQRHQGAEPILLPIIEVGALLGGGPTAASALIQLARTHGLLSVVDDTWSFTEHRAKTYRFNLDSDSYCRPLTVDQSADGHATQPAPADILKTSADAQARSKVTPLAYDAPDGPPGDGTEIAAEKSSTQVTPDPDPEAPLDPQTPETDVPPPTPEATSCTNDAVAGDAASPVCSIPLPSSRRERFTL